MRGDEISDSEQRRSSSALETVMGVRKPSDLLAAATAALTVTSPAFRGSISGSCFLVAPGILATAAHNLGESSLASDSCITARFPGVEEEIPLTLIPGAYFLEKPEDNDWGSSTGTNGGSFGAVDLAFLKLPQ